MATALLSNTARLSLAWGLTDVDCTSSTDSSSTVRSDISWSVQLFTVQTNDTALPHAARHAMPGLTCFPSTSNAATTTHTHTQHSAPLTYFSSNMSINNNFKNSKLQQASLTTKLRFIHLQIFIRLKARLQSNTGFTLRRVLAVFMRSAITLPKVKQFGWNLKPSEYIVGGWSWQILYRFYPCSTDSGRARRNSFLSSKQRTISPISSRPNFTKFEHNTLIGATMKIIRTKFRKFYRKGWFFQKSRFLENFNVLRLHASITLQWLQIAGNSLPKLPSTGFLVFIFTTGINSKSFPWPVHSVQETPNFLQRPTRVDNTADNADITKS